MRSRRAGRPPQNDRQVVTFLVVLCASLAGWVVWRFRDRSPSPPHLPPAVVSAASESWSEVRAVFRARVIEAYAMCVQRVQSSARELEVAGKLGRREGGWGYIELVVRGEPPSPALEKCTAAIVRAQPVRAPRIGDDELEFQERFELPGHADGDAAGEER